jgi:hypothetical protein
MRSGSESTTEHLMINFCLEILKIKSKVKYSILLVRNPQPCSQVYHIYKLLCCFMSDICIWCAYMLKKLRYGRSDPNYSFFWYSWYTKRLTSSQGKRLILCDFKIILIKTDTKCIGIWKIYWTKQFREIKSNEISRNKVLRNFAKLKSLSSLFLISRNKNKPISRPPYRWHFFPNGAQIAGRRSKKFFFASACVQ